MEQENKEMGMTLKEFDTKFTLLTEIQEDLAKALERTDRSNVFYNGLKVADSIVTDKKNKLCAEAGASLVARRNDKNRKLLRETVKI